MRTRFAYYYSMHVTSQGGLSVDRGISPPPPNSEQNPVSYYVRRDLDQSKESFIVRSRQDPPQDNKPADRYPHLYVWAAVEVLSFGTLSRCIAASADSGVLDHLTKSLDMKRDTFASMVKSLVYLRDRIAHHAKIWNHSVADAPGLGRSRKRIKRRHGQFDDHSTYAVLVVLSLILEQSHLHENWLTDVVDPILKGNTLLDRGIRHPRRYGEADLST
ncbi:Abortive infection bacteriophage resistance protein [Actinomyces slackii]|uniref:Abortive infection bacteriophage resistance protein n=1 Tax=Actinomyces slackii TaxID=52774 RepID=A0A3S4UM78_9ACTO|nr:Abortive infection bacteriophage resistance protein [Actinomyces slackii]